MADYTQKKFDKGFGYQPNIDDLIRSVSTKLGTEPKPIDIGLKETVNVTAKPVYGQHPSGIPESIVERMIKKVGRERGTLIEQDYPYLEQYLHPEHEVLPDQPLRPTIGKPLNIPHKHISEYDKGHEMSAGGLGRFTYDTRNPNYDSMYDVWDFDTPSPMFRDSYSDKINNTVLPRLDTVAKEFLKRAGKPFAIYERVPKFKEQYSEIQSKPKFKLGNKTTSELKSK